MENIHGKLHCIRCKLYPNRLPKGEGTYIARTDNEANLTIEQVVDRMMDRGFMGNRAELIKYVKLFFDATAYEICDGFAVNTGYFTIYPKIDGIFKVAGAPYDRQKNPVSFRFRPGVKLHKLLDHIVIDIDGIADNFNSIDTFRDHDNNFSGSTFTPGHVFSLTGYKIKIAGNDPEVGVYFVPVDKPSEAVKVTRVLDNRTSKILGIVPEVTSKQNRIEVRTQFTGSTTILLKAPRVITSKFIIELV